MRPECHQLCVVDVPVPGERAFSHGGESFGTVVDWTLAMSGYGVEEIGIAIKRLHDPVVEGLMGRGLRCTRDQPEAS